MRRPLLSLCLAACLSAACAGPAEEPVDFEELGTLDASLSPGVPCASGSGYDFVCSGGGGVHTAALRVGASATSAGVVAQTFVSALAGAPDRVSFALRNLRPLPGGAQPSLAVEIVEIPAGVGLDDATTVIASGTLTLPAVPSSNGLVAVDLQPVSGNSSALVAGATYAIVVSTRVSPSGTVLVGIGVHDAPVSSLGGQLLRRTGRDGGAGLVYGRYRPETTLGSLSFDLRVAAAGGACALEPRTAWSTLDTYQYEAGQSLNQAIVTFVYPDGALGYAGGAYTSAGPRHWYVRRSTDGGGTWTTDDDYQRSPTSDSQALAGGVIGADGALYLGGVANVETGNDFRGIVRRRDPSSGLWATDDDFVLPGAIGCAIESMVATPTGALVVSGYCYTSQETHAFARRRAPDGTWAFTFDQTGVGSYPYSAADVVLALSNGQLMLATEPNGADDLNELVMFESDDDGLTWTEVDRYRHPNTSIISPWAFGMAESPAGDVYVAVNIYEDPTWVTRWLVRKRTAATGAWSTVDEFDFSTDEQRVPYMPFVDAAGDVYVAGYGVSPTWEASTFRTIVRKTTNDGASWTTSDDFQLDGKGTLPGAPLLLSTGNLFWPYLVRNAGGSFEVQVELVECL